MNIRLRISAEQNKIFDQIILDNNLKSFKYLFLEHIKSLNIDLEEKNRLHENQCKLLHQTIEEIQNLKNQSHYYRRTLSNFSFLTKSLIRTNEDYEKAENTKRKILKLCNKIDLLLAKAKALRELLSPILNPFLSESFIKKTKEQNQYFALIGADLQNFNYLFEKSTYDNKTTFVLFLAIYSPYLKPYIEKINDQIISEMKPIVKELESLKSFQNTISKSVNFLNKLVQLYHFYKRKNDFESLEKIRKNLIKSVASLDSILNSMSINN